jgi:hypothetical protein
MVIGKEKYNQIDWEDFEACTKAGTKIYPVFSPTGDTYTITRMVNGKRRKETLRRVIPEVDRDKNLIRFDSEQLESKFGQCDFRQDEIHYVISRLYEHYADRIKNS